MKKDTHVTHPMPLKYVFTATLILLLCGNLSAMTNRPIYHVIEIGNDGSGIIQDVEITYGNTTIPSGGAHKELPPNHMVAVGETRMMVIPDAALIRWKSADGQLHVVNAQMRSLMRDTERFHGFQFFFVDDHVDIYELNRSKYWPKDIDVERIKIFSSK